MSAAFCPEVNIKEKKGWNLGSLLQGILVFEVPLRVLGHFTHQASVTSIHAEANVYSADWLMSVFSMNSASPCTQSRRSVRAAVPKDYERDFRVKFWKLEGKLCLFCT